MGGQMDKSWIAWKEKLNKLAPYALHLTMVIAVAIYVIIGAYTIRLIEAKPKEEPQQLRMKRDVHEIRRFSLNRTRKCVVAAVEKITKLTNCTKIPDGSYLHIIDECYKNDMKKLAELAKKHKLVTVTLPDEDEPVNVSNSVPEQTKKDGEQEWIYWSMMDAVLFCFTVITTIGYGNVAPSSFHGRLFVIIYGVIGVPFTMLAIANLGKFLATVLKTWTKPFITCLRRCRRRFFKPSYSAKEKQRLMDKESKKPAKSIENDDDASVEEEDPGEEEESNAADGAVLFISFIIYIVVGSMVIAAYEPNMDFFEAIYFNFVTLTTIGLGDLVPQSDKYLVITLIYCAVGLALTTIAIEIAADTLKKLHYFGRKVENVASVQVWFGGKKISMKALVKNLGDQFNVPVDELHNLNIDKFVDDAMKVENGEISTLRQDRDWMNSNYWRAIESGSMHYMDDDDLVTIRSNQSYRYLCTLPASRSLSPLIEVWEGCFIDSKENQSKTPVYTETKQNYTAHTAPITNMVRGLIEKSESCVPLVDSEETENPVSPDTEISSARFSEDAKRRYQEYQKTWRKFSRTASQKE